MKNAKSIRARAGLLLPSLLIPTILFSCTEAPPYGEDEFGPREHPDTIIEEYPELEGVLVKAKAYLQDHAADVYLAASPATDEADYEGKFLIFGAVHKPVIAPIAPRMRLTGAIGAARGLKREANWHSVFVLRRGDNLQDSRCIAVDFAAVVRRGDLAQDLPLRSKDVIYVPYADRNRRVYMTPILCYLKREWSLRRFISVAEKLD